MDRHTPTVAELVRRAAEVADPAERDPPDYVADWLAAH
jgi:hypothetical protein